MEAIMATLNQLLCETDLVTLTLDQREFLVDRIDNSMLVFDDVRHAIASHLQDSLQNLGLSIQVRQDGCSPDSGC
jgi:hypothetical protein